jgi:hypothetical protein
LNFLLKKFEFFFSKNLSQNYQTALFFYADGKAVGTRCCADGNFACAEALLCRRQGVNGCRRHKPVPKARQGFP